MKYFKVLFILMIAAGCQNSPQQSLPVKSDKTMPSAGNFGKEVNFEQAVAADQVPTLFNVADTIATSVFGHISASCKHSGCWMDLDLGNSNTLHVTFKDESFTIPLDAAGKTAIIQGIAIREQIPVETLQNYAREEGKSQAELEAITEPAYAYEFIADGVLIEE